MESRLLAVRERTKESIADAAKTGDMERVQTLAQLLKSIEKDESLLGQVAERLTGYEQGLQDRVNSSSNDHDGSSWWFTSRRQGRSHAARIRDEFSRRHNLK